MERGSFYQCLLFALVVRAIFLAGELSLWSTMISLHRHMGCALAVIVMADIQYMKLVKGFCMKPGDRVVALKKTHALSSGLSWKISKRCSLRWEHPKAMNTPQHINVSLPQAATRSECKNYTVVRVFFTSCRNYQLQKKIFFIHVP